MSMNDEHIDHDSSEKDIETLFHILESGLKALKASAGKDVLDQVEQRKQLAESLSLGARLLRIYDEVKFVPDDRKQQLRRWRCVVASREIQGTDLTTLVRFTLRSKGYLLRLREPGVSYEGVNAYLDVSKATDELLFSIRLNFEVDDAGRQWVPVDVEAFVPGDWVKDFLLLSVQLSPEKHHRRSEPEMQQAEELRRRFGLR